MVEVGPVEPVPLPCGKQVCKELFWPKCSAARRNCECSDSVNGLSFSYAGMLSILLRPECSGNLRMQPPNAVSFPSTSLKLTMRWSSWLQEGPLV